MNEIENGDERARSAETDKLKTRDVVAGAAHAAQLTGVGGPAAHTAAQAIGVADAAIVAKDLVEGKEVRGLDVATAAASVTMTTGVGGPAAQAVAKGVAAVGALDAGERALNTARDALGEDEVARLQARSERMPVYSTGYVEMEQRTAAMVEMRGQAAAQREDEPNGARWAREDLQVLPHVPAKDQEVALDAMHRSMSANRGYASVIEREAPDVAAAIQATQLERAGTRAAEPVEVAARVAVEANRDAAMAANYHEVDRSTAQGWARDDVASLSKIEHRDERRIALEAMGQNAENQTAYRAALREEAPEIATAADAAFRAQLQQRGREEVTDTLLAMPKDTLDPARARRAAQEDVETLRTIEDPSARQVIAAQMGRLADSQQAYRNALGDEAPAIAAEAAVAFRGARGLEERPAVDVEKQAGAAIETRRGDAQRAPGGLDDDAARQMARDDLADMLKIKTQDRLVDAAMAVQDNMKNPAYKAEFEKADGDAARAVDMLSRQGAARLEPEAAVRDTTTIGDVSAERLAAVRERNPDDALKAVGQKRDENEVSERFIADLDKRMAGSELGELGWKGRTDISDVMADLEKLAAKDWNKAAELWQKYRPDDIDKPSFIDGNDIDSKRPKGAERGDAANDEKVADKGRGADKDDDEFKMPDSLKKRYLHAEGKFYFRDEQNKLAFEDGGRRMETQHNDPAVAKSMIELAEAKGWNSIKIKGSEEFKREVWLQASLKGMEVKGFQPKDVDLAKLEDLRKEAARTNDKAADKTVNAIERDAERERAPQRSTPSERIVVNDRASVVNEQERGLSDRERVAIETIKSSMRARGDSEQAVSAVAAVAMERFQTNRVYVGKVMEEGVAPYENNPKNEKSPYIKLETARGEQVVWGVDLPRATKEGGVKVGDDIALAYQGKQPVTVQVPVKDDKGRDTGKTEEITTHRNTWDARRLEVLREDAKERVAAAAERSAAQPIVKVYDRDAARAEQRAVPQVQRAKENERARG